MQSPDAVPRNRRGASQTSSQASSSSEAAPDMLLNAKGRVKEALLALADVPEWLHENEYIHTGYRPSSNSYSKSAWSILGIHNETVNIWSHIIGAVMFVCIPIYVFTTEIPPRYKVATGADIAVCTVYFIGVAICFFLSSTFHTLSNHSARVHHTCVQLDYLGILILMYSANIPLIYYGFVCDRTLRNVYWSIVSVLAGACTVLTMRPGFRNNDAKLWRSLFYTAFGASSFAPIIHTCVVYGWETQKDRMGLVWWFYVALFNLIGVGTYGFKFPERFWPGKFDILGQSHQIMHVAVVVAALMWVYGCLGNFDYLHEHGAVCS